MSGFVCPAPTCTGHIRKFRTCRDEALYLAAAEGSEYTGSMEWSLWAALVTVTPESDVLTKVDYGTHAELGYVRVEPGAYLVMEDGHGFVGVSFYRNPADAQSEYDKIEAAYSEWVSASDD